MNRVIKFRAWDKVYERMNYKVQVGNTDYTDQNYTCNSIWVDYLTSEIVGWMNADEKCIELMQFTGQYEKHCKEIYEGDILNLNCGQILNSGGTNKEVVFSNGESTVIGRFPPFASFEKSVIVGNIFENPELLSK